MGQRILNMLLRGFTLLSRFVLLFCLAKYLSPAEVGQYGIIFATISYVLFILGLDFYTYSTRELIASARADWPRILISQSAFFVVCYVVTLPFVAVFLLKSRVLPGSLIAWFFLLLVTEHIGQEINRLLIAMSKPLYASIVLFVRSGVWVLIGAAVMFLTPTVRTLSDVFALWACGGMCAIGIGLCAFGSLDWRSAERRVDWNWIWRGVKVAVPLLVATLATRLLFVGDRYIEKFVAGDEILGAYTFYTGVAGSLLGFLDAAVLSFLTPRLIASVRSKDIVAAKKILSELNWSTLTLVGTFTLVCCLAIKPLVIFIGKPVYIDHYVMFLILLSGSACFCISMIPHYALYAIGADSAIIKCNIAGSMIFFAGCAFMYSWFADLAVPVALLVAFAFVCISKYLLYINHYRSSAALFVS